MGGVQLEPSTELRTSIQPLTLHYAAFVLAMPGIGILRLEFCHITI